MSKVIISPIERFKGSVTIADPLTIPQAQLIEDGLENMFPHELMELGSKLRETIKQFGEKSKEAEAAKKDLEDYRFFDSMPDTAKSPAIIACVEKWNLENFQLAADGTLPASPRKDTHSLIEWIFRELKKVYTGELEVPNESSPMPISTPAEAQTAEDITAQK